MCYNDLVMSAKYPRSFHLPWSPGGTSDDKRLSNVDSLLGVKLVITEKCDGSNLTYTRTNVYSRSHAGPPNHSSFDTAKATHGRIAYRISEGLSIFCEYCFAVHSIEYERLPDCSLVFGVREDSTGAWWEWDMVAAQAVDLGLPTVPVLYRGEVRSEIELKELTEALSLMPSAFGGVREGVVVRKDSGFSDIEFSRSLAKWVRKNHVITDEHWMYQAIRPQTIRR